MKRILANDGITEGGKQVLEAAGFEVITDNVPQDKLNEELKNFDEKLKYYRSLPNEIYDIIKLTKKGHPMDVLRTCVSSLPSLDKVIKKDSQDQLIENGIKLISQIPIIIAAHQRQRNDMEIVPPNRKLSHSANWLFMLNKEIPTIVKGIFSSGISTPSLKSPLNNRFTASVKLV